MNSIENMFSGGALQGYRDASNTMQNAMGNYSNMISPYIQAGTNSLNPYQAAVGYMGNPSQYIQQLMQGYQMTPQAQYALQQGERAANAGDAATGMAGSGAEQKELQRLGQGITEQDQQQYLQNRLGVANENVSNLANLAGMGEKGADKYGSMAAKMADAAAQDQVGQSEAQQQGKNSATGLGLDTLFGSQGISGLLSGGLL